MIVPLLTMTARPSMQSEQNRFCRMRSLRNEVPWRARVCVGVETVDTNETVDNETGVEAKVIEEASETNGIWSMNHHL